MKLNEIISLKPTQEVFHTKPDSSVFDAISLMGEKGVGALPVIDNTGKLVGMLSERDYTRKIALHDLSSKTTPVRHIMSTNLTTVAPTLSIDEGLALMTNKRIRHLPVIENDKMIGLVSIGDLVKHKMDQQKQMIDQLKNYISG